MMSDWIVTDRPRLPEGALAPMQQHPTYGAACGLIGSVARWYELTGPDGSVLGAAQVLERPVPLLGRAALLSRGPVWGPVMPVHRRREALLRLLDLLRARHRIVAVTPESCDGEDPMAGSGWLEAMTPCHFATLDLDASAAEMRARQHGKWRNRLVRAEAAGLEIRHMPMPLDPRHWLLEREEAQARARRYRRLPKEFTLAWIAQGGRKAARLFTAEKAGETVAAMLFLRHGACASYHIGWSGAEGRATGAHTLLLWEAQRWLARQGCKQLDLDLIDTRTTPGLARFKLGSGARVVTLGATRLSAPGSALFASRARKVARGVGFQTA
ncbi:GNAT family N-acetyltransferase [Tropicimonas sp. TH_r6]|uniref:GNAT family N-acetyltransferase n=1 Tax=Tropicimonas sp. TH_r6 TaxID=3082085 RepID=UPI0029541C91|nr:GNAT family N-acetyltransferase [Tropicimonas sp. TH_r6]MDV7142063.1 GNAT family N-acetyltransferase [Tropicimonas sp. TH_r6]